MTDQFRLFASDLVDEIVHQLESEPQGDEGLVLEDLEDLFYRWGVFVDTTDANRLIEELRETVRRTLADTNHSRSPSQKVQQQRPRLEHDPARLFDLL